MLFYRAVCKDYRRKLKLQAKEKDGYLTINDFMERVMTERSVYKLYYSREK
jgi:hypothetical protein